ncbi:MAG: helix-turn-helix transcriptional regulator [Paramuribaculum sp.]|nr:helix-turn-helix transcriptional regulator [Paramuribaculum sp.]MDE6304470.1 helix-turn-helix transcriptional regulator [Paramuribaculum sp.]
MKNRIKVERAEMDITQQQLAEAVGVSRQTIVAIEKNRFLPSTPLALKISKFFGKPVESIFILEETD